MKLTDTLIFSFSVLFMLIGIHQAMMHGFAASYWLFMLSLGGLLWYQIRKKNNKDSPTENNNKNKEKTGSNTEKRRKYKM